MTPDEDDTLGTQEPLTEEERIEMKNEVDLLMETYAPFTPAPLLAHMRQNLEEGLRSNPLARSLLRRFAPRPALAISGEVVRGGAPDLHAASRKEGA
jgi:hypothetical protein